MENKESVDIRFCSVAVSVFLAAKHLQEAVEQFCKDNPSVNYSDVLDFVVKVRDIFDEV